MNTPLPSSSGAPTELKLYHMDALPDGTMLGEFELQGLLGVGGFGMVYRGYDHSLQRAVAIKEFMPSALAGRAADMQVSARQTSDARPFLMGLDSFIAEARLLARFDHPSLVKVYRFWKANNTAYMAMPLYSGITLKQARRQMSGPPSEAWLRSVLWSVLEALKVLHANKTLHRDVSPDNIFLQDCGPPVLLDLGAARRAIQDGSHNKHTAVLKVNYAPIEQYADAVELREGPWTDLYAVAAVLHGVLCNEPPVPATFRVLRDNMPSFAQVAATVQTHFGQSYSAGFIAALDRALAIQPSDRPQSVEDFAHDMQLQATEDIAQFDWRAALGHSVQLATALEDQSALPTVLVSRTEEKTLLINPPTFAPELTPVPATQPEAVQAVEPSVVVLPANKRQRWLLALAIAGAVFLTWKVREPVAEPTSAAPTEVVSASPVLPVSGATAPSSSPVPMLTELASESVEVVSAPASAARTAPAKTRPASSPHSKPPPVTPPVAKPVQSDKPVLSEPVSQKAEPVVTPKVEAKQLCADSGALSRSMCIYRECQKPEFSALPLCVEDRKKWAERDQNNLR